LREKSMPTTKHLPDQPIMKYVHPADRLRPWFGGATGLAALALMLAFGVLGRNFGTLKRPRQKLPGVRLEQRWQEISLRRLLDCLGVSE
jgi:hypothetical protein